MKKTIEDVKLKGKKVLIRVDFNVPMKNGVITNDNRIVQALPTIKYALDEGGKVILFSHLGRVKTEEDKANNSLAPVAKRLEELLGKKVTFVAATRGKELEDAINNMKEREVVMFENTRFEDVNGKKESGNDPELGAYWASLGDVFVNDAFGTAHRAHASNVGIASNIKGEAVAGFLMEKEIKFIGDAVDNPVRPFVAILGGAKVSDKISVIENLLNKADKILICGAMAYTFYKAKGIVKDNGKVLSEPVEQYCALAITTCADGTLTCTILENQSSEQIEKYDYVIGGFFVILQDGQILEYVQNRRSRTACGTDDTGRILYLFAVTPDFSLNDKNGLSYPECAAILQQLGCTSAMQFDGGHSTAMVINGKTVRAPLFQRKVAAAAGF